MYELTIPKKVLKELTLINDIYNAQLDGGVFWNIEIFSDIKLFDINSVEEYFIDRFEKSNDKTIFWNQLKEIRKKAEDVRTFYKNELMIGKNLEIIREWSEQAMKLAEQLKSEKELNELPNEINEKPEQVDIEREFSKNSAVIVVYDYLIKKIFPGTSSKFLNDKEFEYLKLNYSPIENNEPFNLYCYQIIKFIDEINPIQQTETIQTKTFNPVEPRYKKLVEMFVEDFETCPIAEIGIYRGFDLDYSLPKYSQDLYKNMFLLKKRIGLEPNDIQLKYLEKNIKEPSFTDFGLNTEDSKKTEILFDQPKIDYYKFQLAYMEYLKEQINSKNDNQRKMDEPSTNLPAQKQAETFDILKKYTIPEIVLEELKLIKNVLKWQLELNVLFDIIEFFSNVELFNFTLVQTYFIDRFEKSIDKTILLKQIKEICKNVENVIAFFDKEFETLLKKEFEQRFKEYQSTGNKIPPTLDVFKKEFEEFLLEYVIQKEQAKLVNKDASKFDAVVLVMDFNIIDLYPFTNSQYLDDEYFRNNKLIFPNKYKLDGKLIKYCKDLLNFFEGFQETDEPERKKYADKWYAYYHLILIALGKAEKISESKEEIIQYGQNKYGTKGAGFYQSYNETSINDFGGNFQRGLTLKDRNKWKEIIKDISKNDSEVILWLSKRPN